MSGAKVTVDIAHRGSPALTDAARRLLAATMAEADAVAKVKLQVHPPAGGNPALLVLRLHGREMSEHVSLRECARDCGALLKELGDNEIVVRLQADQGQLADAAS
jgi:hypothetical protein